MNKIEDNLLKYHSYPEITWEKFVFDEMSGGYLVIHRNHHTNERENNIQIGLFFVKEGKRVELLAVDEKIKANPDASIDGELTEFKTIINAVNLKGRFQKALFDAKKQSGNMVIFVNQKYDLIRINKGLEAALFHDNITKEIQKITLILNGDYLKTLSREEIEHGKRF